MPVAIRWHAIAVFKAIQAKQRGSTRGGLVHKDDGGVGNQLHSYGQPLPLLHAQPTDPWLAHLWICAPLVQALKQRVKRQFTPRGFKKLGTSARQACTGETLLP